MFRSGLRIIKDGDGHLFLSNSKVKELTLKKNGRINAENLDEHDGDGVYLNYLYFFEVNRFYK